jgi:GNAT superfamily N-acetyltransferase
LISHPWSTVLVAEVGGVPAAYTVLRLEPASLADHVMARLSPRLLPIAQFLHRPWSNLPRKQRGVVVRKRVAFIDSFVVGKEFRRQGVAERLWEVCQQWSRDHGAEEIQFEVFDFNQAILSFIEYLGMKPYKRRYSKQLSAGGDAPDRPDGMN